MKRQKRYRSEKELLEEIDFRKKEIDWNNEEAEILNLWADVLRDYPGRGIQLRLLREKADRHARRANRIKDIRLPRLSAALAAIRTQVLPGVTDDSSVTL